MSAVAQIAATNCGLPVLRAYWYDGARDAIPTLEQLSVAELANVKLRLGRLSGRKQKGVDALVYRDLMTLARERAVATAFLLAGDEDLREGVVAAQDVGVRVVVLGIAPTGKRPNQSEALIRECDQWIVLQREQLEPFITPASEKEGEAASPEDLGGGLPRSGSVAPQKMTSANC
jgi:NYN domain